MKIIIDPYRGGKDIGKTINSISEKNILLNISKYMSELLLNRGIDSKLTRANDISLTDNERNSIINSIKDEDDLIIQNRISDTGEFNIIYPLRINDKLSSMISNNLLKKGIVVNNYFQKRLPINTKEDYYSIIRNTKPNETIIIEYKDNEKINEIVEIIVDTIESYLNSIITYKVNPGDNLYQIAKKFNISVSDIKQINKLKSNLLSIGQVLKIPQKKASTKNYSNYKVKPGDNLYQIAKKFNTSISEIKQINKLKSNLLSIGQVLKIPTKKVSINNYLNYKVKLGDNLYRIAKKFNTSVSEIKRINKLKSNLLSIDQVLKIPQ